MGIYSKRIEIPSKHEITLIDITREVETGLRESGFKNGIVTVLTYRPTAGLTTIEYEPGLIGDFPKMIERLVPKDMEYGHELRWHDGNGHSHIRSALIKSSQSFNYIGGELQMYPWQQIIFADFAPEAGREKLSLVFSGE